MLASTFPVYQIARNVTRDLAHVRLQLLLPAAAGCPHDYTVSTADLRALTQANILILNGFGLDDFLIPALRKTNNAPHIITAGKNVTPLPATGNDIHSKHATAPQSALSAPYSAAPTPASAHAHEHLAVNPHIFASPRRTALMARTIADELAVLDPNHAQSYQKAASDYAARLMALDAQLTAVGAAATAKGIVVQHDAASYLVTDAGLTIIAVLQENEDQAPSAARLLAVAELMRRKKPALIVAETQYSDRLAQTLAHETGLPVVRIDTGASGPENAPLEHFEIITAAAVRSLEHYLVAPAR